MKETVSNRRSTTGVFSFHHHFCPRMYRHSAHHVISLVYLDTCQWHNAPGPTSLRALWDVLQQPTFPALRAAISARQRHRRRVHHGLDEIRSQFKFVPASSEQFPPVFLDENNPIYS